MNLTDKMTFRTRLTLAMRKGAKPLILATLVERPQQQFTVRELADRVSCSASTARRAAEDLVLARFIEADDAQPRHYWIRESSAEIWKTRILGGAAV